MKLISLTMIMLYLVAAALNYRYAGTTFWNIMFGFAGMLAVFQLINLKVKWVGLFGAIAYTVIAVKILSTPSGEQLVVSNGHIAGLVICGLYCLGLVLAGFAENFRNTQANADKTISTR